MSDAFCLYCHRNIKKEGGFLEMMYTNDVLCRECRCKMCLREKDLFISGVKVHGLYPYSGYVREMMLQYKEYNDEALYPVFLFQKKDEIRNKYADYNLVEIPSSKESYERRGFDHVKSIYSILELPYIDYFEKRGDIQQKNQNIIERSDIVYFLKSKDIDLKDKKILVVDDIVTTGYSMLSAYELLKGRCKKLEFMTVCYSERFFNMYDRIIAKMYEN